MKHIVMIIVQFFCTFNGLSFLTCPDSELTSETMKPFRHFHRTLWTGNRPTARPLPTQDSTTQKNRDMSMPRAGFEPMIPVVERSKTIPTLDGAATGTGNNNNNNNKGRGEREKTESSKNNRKIQKKGRKGNYYYYYFMYRIVSYSVA